mmetsp:Transcript_20999/g.55622  ORF Transcript_20999/g.55622 Transcript_20999/m.55622 type:complete len:300 (-) Transcript_20999:26-925(-)
MPSLPIGDCGIGIGGAPSGRPTSQPSGRPDPRRGSRRLPGSGLRHARRGLRGALRQGRAAGGRHVVRLEGALLGLPDAELDDDVLHVPRVLAPAVHLGVLDADLLGDALDVVLEAVVDREVSIAALGDEELQRARVPQVLAADERLLPVGLVLDRERGAADRRDVAGLDGGRPLLRLRLQGDLHLAVLHQHREAVVRVDRLPEDEGLVARDHALLVEVDEAVPLQLPVAADGASVHLRAVQGEVIRHDVLGRARWSLGPVLRGSPALAIALAPGAPAPAFALATVTHGDWSAIASAIGH